MFFWSICIRLAEIFPTDLHYLQLPPCFVYVQLCSFILMYKIQFLIYSIITESCNSTRPCILHYFRHCENRQIKANRISPDDSRIYSWREVSSRIHLLKSFPKNSVKNWSKSVSCNPAWGNMHFTLIWEGLQLNLVIINNTGQQKKNFFFSKFVQNLYMIWSGMKS